jgi:hypothetical protein
MNSELDLHLRRDLGPSSKFLALSGELLPFHLAPARSRVDEGALESSRLLCQVRSLHRPPAAWTPYFVDACGDVQRKMFLYRPLLIWMICPVVFRLKLCVVPDCVSRPGCRRVCALSCPRCSGRTAYNTFARNPPGRQSCFEQTSMAQPDYPLRPRCSTRRAPRPLSRTMPAGNCLSRPFVLPIRVELLFRPCVVGV